MATGGGGGVLLKYPKALELTTQNTTNYSTCPAKLHIYDPRIGLHNTLELHFPQSIEGNTGSMWGLDFRVTTAAGKPGSVPWKIARLGVQCDCLSLLTALAPRVLFIYLLFLPLTAALSVFPAST